WAVVLLEDAPAQPKLAKAEPAVIDQREMLFIPRVVAVRQGQGVRFDNNDSFNHSVQAVSTLAANQLNQFVGPNQPLTHVFEYQERPVMIGCSLHPWMRAWVYVVRHPWFAVTQPDGSFSLAAVPPGKYTLLVAHPDTGMKEKREVTVEAGKTAKLTVDW